MIKGKRVLGLIPARGGSKGLPGKNIRMLNGRPLIAWSLWAAERSRYLDRVIVSTDSQEIADAARAFGGDAPFMRPADLASDTADSIDVILHALDFCQDEGESYDYLVLLEPTSPLRTVEDIDHSLERLAAHPSAEAMVSMAQAEASHPSFCSKAGPDGLIEPFMGTAILHLRRQDLGEVLFPEGTIYISSVPALKKRRSFYHEKTLAHIVERHKQFEVDEEMDLVLIEALMKFMHHTYGAQL
jgi:CMP-N,N'-diacetyllegionaminic acid synthase